MRVLRGEVAAGTFERPVVTIGNFDGVHLGHRAVCERVLAEAHKRNAPCVAVTFEPHPVKFLRPEKRLRLIYPYAERIALLERVGLDALIIQTFDESLRQTPAHDYCRDFLLGRLDMQHLVVGHDFTFGRGQDGSSAHLARIGLELGFSTEQVLALRVDNEPVSSSRIRHAIAAGDVALARRLLGAPFHLRGLVIEGEHRGATLGYPTANLSVQQELIPADGVYLCCTEIDGRRHPALTNVGDNPTFHHGEIAPRVESWIMDFDGAILGREICVQFIERLRPERKFATREELIEQIRLDEQAARSMLAQGDPCAF